MASQVASEKKDTVSEPFPIEELDNEARRGIVQYCTTPSNILQAPTMQPYSKEIVNRFTARLPPLRRSRTVSSLGLLTKLPVELLHIVILHMDITTLVYFSQTSRQARELVRQHPEFRVVTEHAGTTAFTAVIATGHSDQVTLAQLYDLLTHGKCTTCPQFGGLVFLPTMGRYCLDCLGEDYKHKSWRLRSIALEDGHRLPWWPPSTTVRGWDGNLQKLGLLIIPRELEKGVIGDRPVRPWKGLESGRWTVFNMGPSPVPYSEWLPSPRWATRALDLQIIRLAVSMPVPYLANRKTNKVIHRGVWCTGCARSGVMLPSDYLEKHFPTCQPAQELWRKAQAELDDSSSSSDSSSSDSDDN